ncbi:MAG: hypothetical protein HZY76_04690 [Anaerolineae bacterium]|nr:MAG: hypothetical protein HZY76_04690 [Anaerolineae bacterium]
MGTDMWLKEDVKNILTGVHVAHASLAQHFSDPQVRAYREGFLAALTATAASFGIAPGDVVTQDVAVASPKPHPS